MTKIKTLPAILFAFMAITPIKAMDEPQQGFKLTGVFTTKIGSFQDISSNEYGPGDVAFFSCDSQWYIKKHSYPLQLNKSNIEFLERCKNRGVLCFHLAPTNEKPTMYENREIQFSNEPKKPVKIGNYTFLSKGVIRPNGSKFTPYLQIHQTINFLKQSQTPLKRILYFCDNIYTLTKLSDISLPLDSRIYFISENLEFSSTPKTCQIWLSDKPETHWAFTTSKEEQVSYIRQNPLILAQTFDKPGNYKITFKKILADSVLGEAFDPHKISDPSPLLKTFLYYGTNPVEFAQWLAPLYDKTIWPEVISLTESVMSTPTTQDEFYKSKDLIFKPLLAKLVQAGPERTTIADQLKEQFQKNSELEKRVSILKVSL